ncbi:MAG: ATPase RavA stimulator ViaA, partial [Vibrio sp.]
MLGIEELDLALLIADTSVLEAAVQDLLGRSQLQDLVDSNKNLKTLIQGQISKWKGKVTREVKTKLDDESLAKEVALYQNVVHYTEDEFVTHIDEIWREFEPSFCFYDEAHKLLHQDNAKQNPMLGHYFCQQWHQSLANKVAQIQDEVVAAQKDQQLDDLYKRMSSMQQMAKMSPLDDHSQILGRLWDMSAATLTQGDFNLMKSQADFLKKNPQLLDIAKSLGRMAKQDESEEQVDDPKPLYQESVSEFALDDMAGITQGDDINKLLPNETLFLAYPELEIVFYQHLVEKRLQNYQMKGTQRKRQPIAAHKPIDGTPEEEKGPFIICLDASGSMRGFAEQCAKALSFALMQIALAQSRDCYVIIFSSDLITYELSKKDGLREMSDFLSYTFHGGTDLEKAMQASIDAMRDDKFKNADLVVVSDFIAPKPSKAMQEQVRLLKRNKNRFHAICLSRYGNPEALAIFDHQWDYLANLK